LKETAAKNMPIIKYDPFKEVEKFFEDDFFGFFPAIKRRFEPPMDVYQTDTDLVVELQIPKNEAEKVSVSVEDGLLKIEGGGERVDEEKGKNYFRREIRRGEFTRMISLPVPVKEDEAKAEYENGLLRITIPKEETKKSKKIEVKIK
jgi:HSP20 family protein